MDTTTENTSNPFPDDEIQARVFAECMEEVENKYTALMNELYPNQ